MKHSSGAPLAPASEHHPPRAPALRHAHIVHNRQAAGPAWGRVRRLQLLPQLLWQWADAGGVSYTSLSLQRQQLCAATTVLLLTCAAEDGRWACHAGPLLWISCLRHGDIALNPPLTCSCDMSAS